MPVVVPVDPEKTCTDWAYALLPSLSFTTGATPAWTVGTRLEPGVTPRNAVRFRVVGGEEEQTVADRPRVDVRVWTDGSASSEGAAKQAARVVLANMRRDLRARVVIEPIPLPDPADPSKVHVLFTVELLLRGAQA